jgi:hypothetical protein
MSEMISARKRIGSVVVLGAVGRFQYRLHGDIHK